MVNASCTNTSSTLPIVTRAHWMALSNLIQIFRKKKKTKAMENKSYNNNLNDK